MKKILNLLSILAVFSLAVLISCGKNGGDDPEPPMGQEVAEMLAAATWTISSQPTLEDTPREEWTDFELDFTATQPDYLGGTFQARNQPEEDEDNVTWPDSGNWSFVDLGDGNLDLDLITRSNDNIEISIVRVDVSEDGTTGILSLEFTVEDPGARAEGFYGRWEFDLEFDLN